MKLKLKIFLTVWVNLLAILGCLFLSFIFSDDIIHAFYYTFIGSIFYIEFIIISLVVDLILPFKNESNLNRSLFIEWLVVSTPFFVGIIAAERYILIAFVVPYLISQFILRKKKIVKILENINQVSGSKIEELIK
jgi:hypothetical protein